jgi:kinesin family protein 4/21/27
LIVSKLQLVDLAGSERMTMSDYDSKIAKECIEINKSLFILRKVITTLNDIQTTGKTAYVPYRESKLTSLLKESIGGNSYSLMISALSPSDKYIEENISTLNYSTKAAYIANQPVKNQDPKARLILELKVLLLHKNLRKR